tara:strand:+ start:33 stop:326 length:294 start_codon:yes stop_codon:yes gene_type:complete
VSDCRKVESVFVLWSESKLINEELGCDDKGMIEKELSFQGFERLVDKASKNVEACYDKTRFEVRFEDGENHNIRMDINEKESCVKSYLSREYHLQVI